MYTTKTLTINDSKIDKTDKKIGLIVSLQILIMSIKNMLIQGSPLLLSINNRLNIALFFVIGVIYLWGFHDVCVRIKIRSVVVLMVSFILILFSIILYNQNIPSIKELLPRTILYSFIGFFYISSINDFKYLLKYLTKFSYIIIVASAFSAYVLLQNSRMGYIDSQYNMSLSYFTTVPIMFLIHENNYRKNIISLSLITIGVLIIISFGSRSSILPIFIYIILSFIRNSKVNFKTIIKFTTLTLLLLFIVLNFKYIIIIIINILINRGIYSRTLSLLVSGNITDLSGRDKIYDIVLTEFYKRPFTGIGIGGSNFLTGTGTHSMYLEIFTSLGIIVGSFVFIYLFSTIAKGFYLSKGGPARELILIYTCLVITRGFIGGGLWTNYDLWRLLGLCTSTIATHSSVRYYNGISLGSSRYDR